jgi:hypothetical protein
VTDRSQRNCVDGTRPKYKMQRVQAARQHRGEAASQYLPLKYNEALTRSMQEPRVTVMPSSVKSAKYAPSNPDRHQLVKQCQLQSNHQINSSLHHVWTSISEIHNMPRPAFRFISMAK